MEPDHRPLSRRVSRRSLGVLLLLACCTGCANEVPFYKRKAFADPVMDLGTDSMESAWFSKVHYSMEGAIGGFSSTGGGGCGCY